MIVSAPELPGGTPLVPITHIGCGEVVFHYDVEPHKGDFVTPDLVTLPNGKRAEEGDLLECSKCGPIAFHDLTWHSDPRAA